METYTIELKDDPSWQAGIETILEALQQIHPQDITVQRVIWVETGNEKISNLLRMLNFKSMAIMSSSNGQVKVEAKPTIQTKGPSKTVKRNMVNRGTCPGCNRDNVQLLASGLCRACNFRRNSEAASQAYKEAALAGETGGYAITEPGEVKASRIG